MVCVYCGHTTRVTNSRHQRHTNATWRRRLCIACSSIFTSSERPDLAATFMVKTDSNLERFSRDRLFVSILGSCRHRPSAIDDAGSLTDAIIQSLAKAPSPAGQLDAITITLTSYELLKRFDPVAGAVYQAVHSDVLRPK